MTAREVRFAEVISQQHRAEQEKNNFLSSSFSSISVVLFCHHLDSVFSHCFTKALLPCQEILIRFLSYHPTLLFMPVLYSFTISLVLRHLLAVALFCLLLCATASPHLSGYSLCGLHHAWVGQGLWVALQVERALQKCSTWTETGI